MGQSASDYVMNEGGEATQRSGWTWLTVVEESPELVVVVSKREIREARKRKGEGERMHGVVDAWREQSGLERDTESKACEPVSLDV